MDSRTRTHALELCTKLPDRLPGTSPRIPNGGCSTDAAADTATSVSPLRVVGLLRAWRRCVGYVLLAAIAISLCLSAAAPSDAVSQRDRQQVNKAWAQQWMLRAIMQRAVLVEITDALALPRPRKVPLRSSFASWRSYGRECKRLACFWRDVAIPVLSGIDDR